MLALVIPSPVVLHKLAFKKVFLDLVVITKARLTPPKMFNPVAARVPNLFR
jgi:hypothetical protein